MIARKPLNSNDCQISESGLVYPVAEPYVHDATGDSSDNSYPEAEAYIQDSSGDA